MKNKFNLLLITIILSIPTVKGGDEILGPSEDDYLSLPPPVIGRELILGPQDPDNALINIHHVEGIISPAPGKKCMDSESLSKILDDIEAVGVNKAVQNALESDISVLSIGFLGFVLLKEGKEIGKSIIGELKQFKTSRWQKIKLGLILIKITDQSALAEGIILSAISGNLSKKIMAVLSFELFDSKKIYLLEESLKRWFLGNLNAQERCLDMLSMFKSSEVEEQAHQEDLYSEVLLQIVTNIYHGVILSA